MEALTDRHELARTPNGTIITDSDGDRMRRVTGGWVLDGQNAPVVFGHNDIALPARIIAWGTGIHA